MQVKEYETIYSWGRVKQVYISNGFELLAAAIVNDIGLDQQQIARKRKSAFWRNGAAKP
jgi:hypothetical protein